MNVYSCKPRMEDASWSLTLIIVIIVGVVANGSIDESAGHGIPAGIA